MRKWKREPKPEPIHVHVMYQTKAGSWKCMNPTCKKFGKPGRREAIWSPNGHFAAMIGGRVNGT